MVVVVVFDFPFFFCMPWKLAWLLGCETLPRPRWVGGGGVGNEPLSGSNTKQPPLERWKLQARKMFPSLSWLDT